MEVANHWQVLIVAPTVQLVSFVVDLVRTQLLVYVTLVTTVHLVVQVPMTQHTSVLLVIIVLLVLLIKYLVIMASTKTKSTRTRVSCVLKDFSALVSDQL